MAPLWSFGSIAAAFVPNPSEVFLASNLAISSSTSQTGTTSPATSYATSSATSSTSYSKLSLLGLAPELRDRIWQCIFDKISASNDESGWAQRPTTAYGYVGLSLTCHKIRDEIAYFWPRTIVQHRRIATFLQPPISTLQDFRRLSLEIPMNEKYQFFLAAASTLKSLAPVLQDLRIFFVGSDRFQVPLSLSACGIHEDDIGLVSKRLAIDGQAHSIRQPLFVALRNLQNLHSLVISNHNYPILPKMVLEYKYRLTKLRLETDARTTIHMDHEMNAGGLTTFMIRPIQHGFPPVSHLSITIQNPIHSLAYSSFLTSSQVETLAISANASINSLALAGACTLSLRHLTWTVPDLSLQSPGGVGVNWYRDTANLFYVLRSNSKQLKTLRMCFHEAIYEADTAAGTLVPAFRLHLEHLPLENLELHINSQSPWFGAEILQYLPTTLRRLYLSRELIDEQQLSLNIDNRYMSCQPTSDGDTPSRFLQILQGADEEEKYIHVGEDLRRKDFISLGGGKLGFVGYEYEPTKATRSDKINYRTAKADDTRAWMMKLNGRLLDRERNAHLIEYDGAKHIPPPYRMQYSRSAEKCSISSQYGPMWVTAPRSIKETEAAASEYEDSVLAKYVHQYFGKEDEAMTIFQTEPCVHPDDVPRSCWADEVSMLSDEHWQTDPLMGPRKSGLGDAEVVIATPKNDTSHSNWEKERTAHWVSNWTWYPQTKSYTKDDERESFMAERSGEGLKSLKSLKEATTGGELQDGRS